MLLEVLAWVMTACWVLCSTFTSKEICIFLAFSIFRGRHFNKYAIWDTMGHYGTLQMMLFTTYLIKWKCIGKISWKFRYWFYFKFSIQLYGISVLSFGVPHSLGSRREAFLSQNIRTCMCSFTLNPGFHQNSKIFSCNLALPLIYKKQPLLL